MNSWIHALHYNASKARGEDQVLLTNDCTDTEFDNRDKLIRKDNLKNTSDIDSALDLKLRKLDALEKAMIRNNRETADTNDLIVGGNVFEFTSNP